VDPLVTIGEFSKMTYLSVKALRHYHEVRLLEPVQVDASSGYRLYAVSQVGTAQAIRRFRELDMPLEQVRAVLEAPDVESRNQAILAHLEHMQQQLERTQTTVASLQELLREGHATRAVEYRSIDAVRGLAVSGSVRFDDTGAWCTAAFEELHAVLSTAGSTPAGPDGALYFDEFFEEGEGRVIAFVPVTDELAPTGRTAPIHLAATDVAVMIHTGPFADLDQTYGALGTVVAERGIGAPGPIREHYLVGPGAPDESSERTEVCWPVISAGATVS
jgi:DNA-binding transcriptional MerR regulator